jgi:hypothetical protein
VSSTSTRVTSVEASKSYSWRSGKPSASN